MPESRFPPTALVEGLVAGGHAKAAELRRSHRFGSEIGNLALAIHEDRPDDVLTVLRRGGDRVTFIEDEDHERHCDPHCSRTYSRSGKLPKPATRTPPWPHSNGIACFAPTATARGRHVLEPDHRALDHRGDRRPSLGHLVRRPAHPGRRQRLRPRHLQRRVSVTARRPDGFLHVYIESTRGRLDFSPGRLGNVETLHAMTIHKSQGSQAAEVTVLLPGEDSRLLTCELFYTAVTRSQDQVHCSRWATSRTSTFVARWAVMASAAARGLAAAAGKRPTAAVRAPRAFPQQDA
ncbi:ATP-binding domain-containing protein [Kribbella sp. CA-245084]|uniref:ATP-binding domain-containing protein n=1 Tax=Kribbella sp. CA-245084 TaxID=3239940 RepID=UPI003D9476EE